MKLSDLNFTEIKTSQQSVDKNNNDLSIVLYFNHLYLPSSVANLVADKTKPNHKDVGLYKYAVISFAKDVLSIEFTNDVVPNINKVKINYHPGRNIICGWIGGTELAEKIFNKLNLPYSKDKFYYSIESEINGNKMYFKFSSEAYRLSKNAKNQMKGE